MILRGRRYSLTGLTTDEASCVKEVLFLSWGSCWSRRVKLAHFDACSAIAVRLIWMFDQDGKYSIRHSEAFSEGRGSCMKVEPGAVDMEETAKEVWWPHVQ